MLASSSDLAPEPAGLILGSGAEVPQVTATSRISPGPPIGAWRPEGLPGTASGAAHGPVSPCLQGRAPPIKGWLWATRATGHLRST